MFGVCYYPEHWPRSAWRRDAEQMAELGLRYVRIGEFAWSRLEPTDGNFDFDWLDDAIEVLASAGLEVLLCTPTATPPKWLIDKWPEMLPVDPDTGRPRGFGSRRHYDFSSDVYLREALRISEAVARRYGRHKDVVGWQTDNELCCHDTALSASDAALAGFRSWCRQRYGTIDALNTAWGNVFWSMEYRGFREIELPVGAVTETSPAHRLAYRRYSSEKVVRFHDKMVAVIREHSPGRFVTHNFIPMVDTGVDNFALAAPLDFASDDNYPLGRADLRFRDQPADEFRKYMRTGHPDYSSFSFDQTRGLCGESFWVMEQQPGPVNWAPSNPRPAPGMVRLWTLEAFAHGADCVSFFRWRQAPFAQEQMHAGLLRPDNSRASGWPEIENAISEANLLNLKAERKQQSAVAIVTDAHAYYLSDIERQSDYYDYDHVLFDYYRALRENGISVDFVSPESDLAAYELVFIPCLPTITPEFVKRCEQSEAIFVFGPRCGAMTDEFCYAPELPPGALQRIAPLRVLSVETIRPDCPERLTWNDREYESHTWREELHAPEAEVLARFEDDNPAVVRNGRIIYIGSLTSTEFLRDLGKSLCNEVGVESFDFGADIRVEKRGTLVFAFNYSATERDIPLPKNTEFLLGSRTIKPYDVAVWRRAAPQLG